LLSPGIPGEPQAGATARKPKEVELGCMRGCQHSSTVMNTGYICLTGEDHFGALSWCIPPPHPSTKIQETLLIPPAPLDSTQPGPCKGWASACRPTWVQKSGWRGVARGSGHGSCNVSSHLLSMKELKNQDCSFIIPQYTYSSKCCA
jgi:hypothetical protein